MHVDGVERRKFKRVFFNPEDQIAVTLTIPGDSSESFPATLLNVSEGGMGVVATRNKTPKITNGSQLVVREIILPDLDGVIKDVEIITRHVLDLSMYDHITFGCEFTSINENEREKIRDFVAIRFKDL